MDNLYSVTLGTASGGNGYTRRHVIAASALTNTPVNRVRVRFQSSATAYTITDAYIGLQATSGDAYDIDPATMVRLTQGANTTLTITTSADLSDLVELDVDGTRAVVVSVYGATSQIYLPGTLPAGYTAYHKLASDAATADASGYSTTATNIIGFRALEGMYVADNLVRAELVQAWGDAGRIMGETVQPWGIKFGLDLRQPWGDAPALHQELYQVWGDAPVVRASLVQRWESSFTLRADLVQRWNIFDLVRAELLQPWAITADLVRAELSQPWDLRERDLLHTDLVQRWAIEADGGLLRYSLSVLVDGMPVGVSHLNIEAGSDQDVLTGELHIGTESDYLRCTMGAEVTITLTSAEGTDTFNLVITAPRISEEHGNTQYIVEAMSPAVLLGEPYAATIEGELSGQASIIAATLAGSVPITWNTVDWTIPAATWIASGETPLGLLKRLAEACGGVLQSLPDGSLTVEPEYTVAVNRWGTATPGLALVEILDCYTTGDTPELRSGYNRFFLSDQSASSASLRLEEEQVSKTEKMVRGYQVPWTGAFDLIHSGGAWVQIEPLGVETRQQTETIEIISGAGRTQYPIVSRDAVVWGQTNLGSVTVAEDGGVTAQVEGESLLTLTYTTRCKLWRVRDPRNEQLQLVAP